MKNSYWVISRDKETTELKLSKLLRKRFEAREYFPYFKSTRGPWENAEVSLETLPAGELPKMKIV